MVLGRQDLDENAVAFQHPMELSRHGHGEQAHESAKPCSHNTRTQPVRYGPVSAVNFLFKHANDYGDDIWIASYDEAAKYFLEWSTASVVAELKGNVIAVNLVTEETDERLNLALTVKVNVPDSYESITVDGEELEIKTDSDGSRYVLVDAVPGETVLLNGSNTLGEEIVDPFGMK